MSSWTAEQALPLKQDWMAWLALAAGMALTAWSAAPAGSWLDSGELIAAARTLGGIHPPGHPGWLSLAGLAELLPLGPVAARVAWLSSLFAGVSALLVVRIARELLAERLCGWVQDAWVALAAVALLGFGSLWQVSVRAEVYTLTLATNLWMLLAALRAGQAADAIERGPMLSHLGVAALALSLGLTNHHYVTLFAVPAAVVAAWPALWVLVRKEPRALAVLVATCLFVGLGYAALWLRAQADVELRWGHPASWSGLWDAMTAKQFQKSVSQVEVSIADNALILLAMVIDSGAKGLGALGLGGLGLAVLRKDRTALVLPLVLLGGLMTKALMQIDTHNPDDHGYVLLAAAALALGLVQLGAVTAGARPERSLAALTAVVAPVILLFQTQHLRADPASHLAELRAPDTLDALSRRAVAPGALVLTNYYGSQYAEAMSRLAEGRRPDWVVAHLSFRTGDTDGGAGFAAWFSKRHTDFAVLAQAAQHYKRAPVGNALQLVEAQPVFAESDPAARIPEPFVGFDGQFQRLLLANERGLDYDPLAIRERQKRLWDRLYQRLTPADLADHPTKMVLLWQHSLQAAHALRRGWRDQARDELARARALAPEDRQLARLEQRLAMLDAAWNRSDIKEFNSLWQRWLDKDLEWLLSGEG